VMAVVVAVAAGGNPNVKIVPVHPTSASSGAEMYSAYCSSCHGVDGKGNGVAAPGLKMRPANLTDLAVRNGGKFPALEVVAAIRDGNVTAHRTSEMPAWGKILGSVSDGQMIVLQRIANLTAYIESMQVK
jgi:mono/diheme cytochrome c family protein